SPTVSTPANNSSINKTTPTISGGAGTATGDNTTVTVKIYNGTGTGGSVAQTFNNVAVTSGSWSVSATALVQATYTAQVTQGDSAGNSGSATSTFTVDTTAPSTTDDVPAAYVNHNVTVTRTEGGRGGEGVGTTYYTTDGSVPPSSSTVYSSASNPVLTSDGQVIKYFSSDKAGNEEAVHSATAHIDRAAPSTTDDVPAAYVNHNVTVTLTASDTGGAGVDKTYYTTDGSVPTSSSSVYNSADQQSLTSDGQVIKYFSTDKAGNAETPRSATAHIQTDTTPPGTTDNVDGNWHALPVGVTLTATDNVGGSGVKSTSYKVYTGSTVPAKTESGWQTYETGKKPSLGNGQAIAYYSVDYAGNQEGVEHSNAAKVDGVGGVTSGATYTLGSVPPVVCTDPSASIAYSGKVGQ